MPDPELLNQQSAAAPQAAAATATPAATPAAATALPNAPATSVAGSSATPAPAAAPAAVAAAPNAVDAARTAKSQKMTSVAGSIGTQLQQEKATSGDKSNGAKTTDAVDAAAGVVGGAKDEFGSGYKEVNKAQGKEEDDLSDTVKADMKGMAIGSGAMGALSGIKAMAASFQTLTAGDTDALDRVDAAMSMGAGAAGAVGSASNLTNEVASEGSKAAGDSKAVGAMAGNIGGAISSIKSAFTAIKDLVKLVKERGESSKKEKAIEGLGVAQSMVESAKSTLSTINGIKEAIDGGSFGGVAAAIPGLDIALAGISIIKEGVHLVIAYKDYKQISADKEAQMVGHDDLADSAEGIRVKESEISNLQNVISKDEMRLAELDAKIPSASVEKGILGGASEKTKLEAEKVVLVTRLTTMRADKATATTSKTKLETDTPEALEFALVGEIAEANKKRIVRNSILMVADFANLAGSIANLTGVGAVAGAGLKTASAAVKVALPAARAAKQIGRDSAADAEAKGESTMGLFDTSKSTAAKRDYRMKQVNTLLLQIQGLNQLTGPAFDERAAKLESYISAMGVSPNRLYALNNQNQEQITMLYKALCQRE